jgi:hypothetical protein
MRQKWIEDGAIFVGRPLAARQLSSNWVSWCSGTRPQHVDNEIVPYICSHPATTARTEIKKQINSKNSSNFPSPGAELAVTRAISAIASRRPQKVVGAQVPPTSGRSSAASETILNAADACATCTSYLQKWAASSFVLAPDDTVALHYSSGSGRIVLRYLLLLRWACAWVVR